MDRGAACQGPVIIRREVIERGLPGGDLRSQKARPQCDPTAANGARRVNAGESGLASSPVTLDAPVGSTALAKWGDSVDNQQGVCP